MNPLHSLQVNRQLDQMLDHVHIPEEDKEQLFTNICEIASLSYQMKLLHECMEEKYKESMVYRDHSTLYHCIADLFNLYDDTNSAPIWLSRIVDGFLNDKMSE